MRLQPAAGQISWPKVCNVGMWSYETTVNAQYPKYNQDNTVHVGHGPILRPLHTGDVRNKRHKHAKYSPADMLHHYHSHQQQCKFAARVYNCIKMIFTTDQARQTLAGKWCQLAELRESPAGLRGLTAALTGSLTGQERSHSTGSSQLPAPGLQSGLNTKSKLAFLWNLVPTTVSERSNTTVVNTNPTSVTVCQT